MAENNICGAECRDGSPCQNPPLTDANRCRMHGGHNSAENGQGGPEGNGNNEKHGLRADRQKWFERHREDCGDLVRAIVASYVEDAPFGWEQMAKVDKLTEVAIDQVRLRHSNKELDSFLTEKVVEVTEDGRKITELEAHPGHRPRDRIKKTNLKVLKELGILDDPDSQQAAATEDLADAVINFNDVDT